MRHDLLVGALLFAAATAFPALAQQPQPPSLGHTHDQAPTAAAARRTGSVQIDGRLNEAAWQAATPVTEFRQVDPNAGELVSERTEASILIDDEALYVGVRLYDSQPGLIQSQLARRDEGIEGDLVEVYFDSYHDHLTAVVFRLSPAGARRDAALTATGQQDNSWDAVWEGRASVDSLGWMAEFRIPLSQLRYDPGVENHVWGLQIGRKIARKAEVAVFSYTPKDEQQGVHRYGHLTGLGRLPSPRRFEVSPYVLAKNAHPTADRDDPFRTRNEVVPGAGVDVKYGLTSNFTLDVTVNPDFGQVEVDPAVVNLSAFETFYPERRPFFVEGAGIFRFGAMRTNNSSAGYTLMHTRRIGRAPQRLLSGPDITYVDAPLETTIAAAAKLTGRSSAGWSLGLLNAVTTREEARFRTVDGADHRATVEPLANYFTGRVKRDMRRGNTTVGAVLSSVHRHLDDAALEPLFRRASYIGGVDWNHAWGNRRWAFDGAVVMSHNEGSAAAIEVLQRSPARYLQRPDRRSHHLDPLRTSLTGHMAEFTLAKIAGRHWRGSVTVQDYSPGFELNEGGFLGNTGMRGIAPLISYSETQPGRYLRNWTQYLFWNPTWNYDGDVTFNGVGSISVGELRNYWNYFLRLDWRPPVTDDGLTRGGPVATTTTDRGIQAELSSDRRQRTTYGIFGSYFRNRAGGWTNTFSPFVNVRPSTAMRVSLQPTLTRRLAMAQYVTRVNDPLATDTYGSRYLFASLRQNQLSMVTRVDWTFSPALSLQVFAQPLIAAGDFHDYKEFARPRDFAFHVYGRDRGTITRDDAGMYTVDPDGAGAAPSFRFGDRDFNQRSLRGNAVLRWEYRPGSTLFLVWQQVRFDSEAMGEFSARRDFGHLLATRPENVFVIKATYWMGW